MVKEKYILYQILLSRDFNIKFSPGSFSYKLQNLLFLKVTHCGRKTRKKQAALTYFFGLKTCVLNTHIIQKIISKYLSEAPTRLIYTKTSTNEIFYYRFSKTLNVRLLTVVNCYNFIKIVLHGRDFMRTLLLFACLFFFCTYPNAEPTNLVYHQNS